MCMLGEIKVDELKSSTHRCGCHLETCVVIVCNLDKLRFFI